MLLNEDIRMSTVEKYNQAFCETFEVDEQTIQGLEYQSIQAWDSVGHMALMAASKKL